MAEPILDRSRTHAFRYGGRSARWALVMLAFLLLLTVASTAFAPGFDASSNDPLWAAFASACLVGLMAAFAWLALKRPVVLRIGPDGIDMPIGFSRPLTWSRIHRVRRLPASKRWIGKHDWLIVDPSPGVLPEWRLSGPRQLDLWLMPPLGLRIPLHVLDAAPGAVIASIERFHPVIAALDPVSQGYSIPR